MKQILPALNLESASAKAQPILAAVKAKFGFIPNLMGTFANNPETLKGYMALSDSFSNSGLSALEQQIVAITVSQENSCDYCVAAHTAISMMGNLDEKVIQQLRSGSGISDKKLEALRTFTKRVVSARGFVDESDLTAFTSNGYTANEVSAVILGVAMKTLSNYNNHIAHTELDEPFKQFAVKN